MKLILKLQTKYIYSTEEAAERVKSLKGYVHVSMESQRQKDGSKLWRIIGYRDQDKTAKSKKDTGRRGFLGKRKR